MGVEDKNKGTRKCERILNEDNTLSNRSSSQPENRNGQYRQELADLKILEAYVCACVCFIEGGRQ